MRCLRDPAFVRKMNGWILAAWCVYAIPALTLSGLRSSIWLISFYSVYSILVSHYTAWLAGKVNDNTTGDGTDQ